MSPIEATFANMKNQDDALSLEEKCDIPPVIFNGIDVTPQSLIAENVDKSNSIDLVPLLRSGVGMNAYNSSSLGNLISLELISNASSAYSSKEKNKSSTKTYFFIDTDKKNKDKIFLSETKVFQCLKMPGTVFANDNPSYATIKENDQCKKANTKNVRRIERPTQTFGCAIRVSFPSNVKKKRQNTIFTHNFLHA